MFAYSTRWWQVVAIETHRMEVKCRDHVLFMSHDTPAHRSTQVGVALPSAARMLEHQYSVVQSSVLSPTTWLPCAAMTWDQTRGQSRGQLPGARHVRVTTLGDEPIVRPCLRDNPQKSPMHIAIYRFVSKESILKGRSMRDLPSDICRQQHSSESCPQHKGPQERVLRARLRKVAVQRDGKSSPIRNPRNSPESWGETLKSAW